MSLRILEAVENSPAMEVWLGDIKKAWGVIPSADLGGKISHLAVICDGNRRAAEARGLPKYWGHRAGLEVILGIAGAGKKWGIDNLTFWTWSTGNWKRDSEQIEFVMTLAREYLRDPRILDNLRENQAKFRHVGRKDRLPQEVVRALGELEEKTVGFGDRTLSIAMDYGGVDEVQRAVEKMFALGAVAPQAILGYLDTVGLPDPELVIRTGEGRGRIKHTSGFMPLQTSEAGWAFTEEFFPDLTPNGLKGIIDEFSGYEMRKGK